MTITRETLELAALAAGYEVVCTEAEMHGCDDASTIYTGVMLRGVQSAWRPHTDIADAARLALRLEMEIEHPPGRVVARYGEHAAWAVRRHDGTQPDKERAYCEAVTLCAAEIGRRMREGGR